MRNRSYNSQSAIFILIAIIFLIVLDRAFFSEKPRQHIPVPQTVAIQTEPPPVILGEAPHAVIDFGSAMSISAPEPVLPKIDDQPAWKKNAVVSVAPHDKPRVVIIIDDMGLDRKHSQEAMDLPAPLTLSFMPYAEHLREQTSYAISKGHELMVHLPMEPGNPKINAGPKVLKVNETPEQFSKILDDDLASFGGYVGVNNHMGSKMTQDRAGMRRLMAELKKRGLLFVDSRTISTSVAADEAKKAEIPYAVRNVFLDDEETSKAIGGSLEQVEKTALKKGLAIAIGHPHAETIASLKEWIPTLKDKGIELIPISAAVTVPDDYEFDDLQ
jgi:polysaccharide deacetylase 2 family uncharacterized protein YibQ